MGLNDSFSQVRGQLLLMDPLLSINKVFALISQEKHQRKIGAQVASGSDKNGAMTFAFKTETTKKLVDLETITSTQRMEMLETIRRTNRFVLTAIIMVIQLTGVTRYMDIHRVTNPNRRTILTILLVLIQ